MSSNEKRVKRERRNRPLTVKEVERLKKRGRTCDGHGLYLEIATSGAKGWVFRYKRKSLGHRRLRSMCLGPTHTLSLTEAREAAREARKLLLAGVDPIEARKIERAQKELAARREVTFREAARQYFGLHEKRWRNPKHRKRFNAMLETYAYPTMGDQLVSVIDTPMVLRVIEPLWVGKNETAYRVRGHIEAVLSWATANGLRSGDNPARWRGLLETVLPPRRKVARPQRHPSMPFAEVPAFLADLREREGASARALEFLVLTAARTGEVIGATWDEIDLNEKLWVVPAERMKAGDRTGKEHRVPLTEEALRVLAEVREDGEPSGFVFPGLKKGRGLSDMSLSAVLRRMKVPPQKAVVHGFRASFKGWCDERTSFPNHVIEMALSHAVGNAVERAYRRTDLLAKRRRLMEQWSQFCFGGRAEQGEAAPKIVSLRPAVMEDA